MCFIPTSGVIDGLFSFIVYNRNLYVTLWEYILLVGSLEYVVVIDKRGRVVMPLEVRETGY